MDLKEYYEKYGPRITQQSERLFVEDFLYPLLGPKIEYIIPQYPFIDRTGRGRRIDFVYRGKRPIALEVNGESYHGEGIIPDEMFDENLFRQNEILNLGYYLVRFSYSQLQSAKWRPIVTTTLRELFAELGPELLSEYALAPTPLQREALEALTYYREKRGWKKGVVILPTGTGKTVMSALDAQNVGGPVLFLVHRLDILRQSVDAYKLVWPKMKVGYLTGEARENERECDVLFSSKDTLRQPDELARFPRKHFNYIVVDEVHHGQSPSYKDVLEYFSPKFMLGMTATPDRTDRKDIFELFDYNKIYEIPLQEAIERGYLVPYSYYGLTDNIDYSQIRYQNQKYRVDDLERYLIIPERNNAILKEYIEKGEGDKAIGFCVSIEHAERMAEFFDRQGIAAAAIHSGRPDRDILLKDFRENRIQVAFTVDLFNEGMDFPNVRILLFLRPTESKTVFIQQLGRGLRLCVGKDRVRVLDFIGNYKRANQIRKYLSKDTRTVEVDDNGRWRKKTEYIYSNGCEVRFDPTVEEILDRQDALERGIDKDDLKEAYFALAEKLGRKPSRDELDAQGEYKSAAYARLFGSWLGFLREVGEYTEASYHYPQGTHLGHILSILWYFGQPSRAGTHFDDEYIRMRGNLGEGRISLYRRQVKYKLQAAMELRILEDDRHAPPEGEFIPSLTPLGRELLEELRPFLSRLDLSFPRDTDGIPMTSMADEEPVYNKTILEALQSSAARKRIILRVFLQMHAAQQMLAFLYHVCRSIEIPRNQIYEQFFAAPFVKQFCDQEGIEEATLEASRRRCPFLLNILDACGLIAAGRSSITVLKLALMPSLVRPYAREELEKSAVRMKALEKAWPDHEDRLQPEDLSIVRELFGASFLTDKYHLKDMVLVETTTDA